MDIIQSPFKEMPRKVDMRGWKADEIFWEGKDLWIGALRHLSFCVGDDVMRKYTPMLTEQYKHAVERCESPIELYLLTALFAECWFWNDKPIITTYCKDATELTNSKGRVCLMNQCEFFGYRMDFTMKFQRHGTPIFLCIEADGAAYHNDTKDSKRDAELKRRGVTTLRFTGSKIKQDPTAITKHINSVATEIETTGNFVGYAI